MFSSIVDSSVRMRRLVVAGVIAVLAFGIVQLGDATVDVYPEFEQTAVQIQTEALGLSAEEVEQLITSPMEHDLLNGIPWLERIRSKSMPGLSAIDLEFEEGTDLWLARQMVAERMSQAHALPNVGTPPVMVQPTASTSRVAMVALTSEDVSMIDMSVLARWQMRPRLMAIPGVAQVSIWGQRERQLQVQVDSERLQSENVTLTQLIETAGNALWVSPLSFVEASTPGTGGFIETPSQRIGVQHVSPISTSEQLADIAIEGTDGKVLGDVADVVEDHQPLIGDATAEGDRSLLLVVERFPDADVDQVTEDVEDALAAMSAGLPGITVDTDVYRPAGYLTSGVERLGVVALVGALAALGVVGLLTRSWRTVLIAAGSVATSLVAALVVLRLGGSPLTTMTLLGLAAVTALVIDDVVGDVSRIQDRAREARAEGRPAFAALIGAAVRDRRGPLVYATLIAFLALVPLLFLRDPAGAFVRPALLVFVLAALVSFVAALVVTPVLAVLLQGGRTGSPAPFDRVVRRVHERALGARIGRRAPALVCLLLLAGLLAAGLPALRSGSLLPQLQDRNVLVRMEGAPGTALAEMDRVTGLAAAELRDLDGVEAVATHSGRAVGADEVVDVESSEMWVRVDPDADYTATLDGIRGVVGAYPGLRSEVRTYADDRLSAVTAGTDDRLVVRVSGADYALLQRTAEDVAEALKTVEGVILPEIEPISTQPTVSVQVDLAAAEKLGLRPGDVRREVSTLVSGLTVGSLYEQQAIFDVVIWGSNQTRANVESMESMLVHTPTGDPVRLGDVASIGISPTPTVIEHDGVHRSLDVTAEVRGRAAADVAADATERLRQMTFEEEYRAEVLGDAVERADARRTLLYAGIAVVVVAFLLLQAAVNGWRGAAVLFVATPLAASGALLAGYPLGGAWSAPVLGAAAAVVLLAIRQSLVLVRRAQQLRDEAGTGPVDAVRAATAEQAPAVVTTALVAAAAFLPASVLGRTAGLEMLAPFGIALIAGLITSVLVVLVLVPSAFAATGALRPAPVIGPDSPDGVLPEHHGRHERPEEDDRTLVRTGGSTMRIARPIGIGLLALTAGWGLTGCQTSAGAVSAEDAIAAAASVEADPGGGPSVLHLTEDSVLRLGLETEPVAGTAGALTIPYAAVVYAPDGTSWAFAEIEDNVFQRQPVTIAAVEDDTVQLTEGPEPGTEVVTVAAAELVGVEAGISGGE